MVDLLPDQTRKWQKVESIVRKNFRRAALEEIRTPLLEPTDLFARGIGEGTDVVGKEMYTFCDRGERSCTLRPEGTASVVRAIIQNGLVHNGSQRLWYGGPMFRYERPQAGRQRQFHQIGVELFGFDSIESDFELISIGWDLLMDLGLTDLTLEINSLGNVDDRKNFHSIFVSWLEERFSLLDKDSQNRLRKNPLRILDTKNLETQNLLLEAPSLQDALSQESLERFEALQVILTNQKIPFTVNSRLVRGLDYYCHTAFEIKSEKLGAQSTICGGGRYDGLVKQLGGPEISSIGWAIGLERLMILLEDSFTFSSGVSDIYLINRGELAKKYALALLRKLRDADFSVEMDHTGSTFSKQFKRADRSGSMWAVILGDDEISEGSFKLRKLSQELASKEKDKLFPILQPENLIIFLKKSLEEID
tara:strand:- start:1914 stop:3176 length:1263 start_codon:yes stop_codon:yes gene_type:complete